MSRKPATVPDWRRDWRAWLTMVGLALLAIVVTQDVDEWLIGRVPRPWHLVVAYTLNDALVLVPILLFVVWREAARREAQARKQLQETMQLREDLTHMLVHDLKNPLVNTGLALRALQRRMRREPRDLPQEASLLSLARDSCSRMERMVADILDVARSEAGHLSLNVETCDLPAVVHQAASECAPCLDGASSPVKERYAEDCLLVQCDADKLRRVITNLLDNALRFNADGKPVSVDVWAASGEARVSVSDSGPGIPVEWRERIFERYSQAEATHKANRRSVGLGLTFCKLAVEAHGGRIWVEDGKDGGATFVLSLPLSPGAAQPAAAQPGGSGRTSAMPRRNF